MTWRRSLKKRATRLQPMKKVLSSFTLYFSHLLTPFFFLSFPSLSLSFWHKTSIKTCVITSLFFLDRSPVGVKLSVAHTGHLCLIFKGLGPSMAGQDFARYGQKKTFRSVPKLQLELSTDQLITRGLCRQPSETSDHVRLFVFLSLSFFLFFFCLFFCVMCTLACCCSLCMGSMKHGMLRVCFDRFVEQQQLYTVWEWNNLQKGSPVF